VKPKLDEEDVTLFREAVRDVKPLSHTGPSATPRKRPARARFSRSAHFANLEESLDAKPGDPLVTSGEPLAFRRPGVAESVTRKLRRGEYPVEGELDLHGLTVAQARQALRAFLTDALARHAGCVRIIHGKGLRSGQQGPVLKSFVNGVLQRTSAVAAYVSARPADGGTGALYVLLSPRDRKHSR
jgi:DNA-nicking Smr family endonuclease